MSGPTANNPFDVCDVVVATFIGNAPKRQYRIYAELLQLQLSWRKPSSSVISRMQPRERRTAKEESTTSSQGTLWEDVPL
jgi:hypothetical protein